MISYTKIEYCSYRGIFEALNQLLFRNNKYGFGVMALSYFKSGSSTLTSDYKSLFYLLLYHYQMTLRYFYLLPDADVRQIKPWPLL
jgi:hypothetical protein